MKKDLYEILGIRQGADLQGIKRAYRAAAKRHHPDVSPQDEERFRDLQEAYETLSDPVKRAGYDRELLRQRRRSIPQEQGIPPGDRPFGLFDPMEAFDAPWHGSWMDSLHPSPGIYGDPVLEVVLTPEEAGRGGALPVDIPFWAPCGRCRGSGDVAGRICGWCRGAGRQTTTKRIWVSIPMGVASGVERRVHLDFPDIGAFDFVLTITVTRE
jgi:DnaJ-class molecular chaperone